jgi:hypothetical protein
MIRRILLLSGLAMAAVLASGAPTAQPSAEWIKRTKERIDLLLGPKHDTSPLRAGTPNPFRPPGKADPEPARPSDPTATTKISDNEALARLVATLKINGLVQIGGVPQVIINQLSYKEGDLVAVRAGEQATYLRVIRITTAGLTLEMGKVEQTILLK